MERIYVTVRPKPVSVEDSKTNPWRISGNSISLSPQSTKFEFDHIFREECKTAEVYEARTKDIVSAAVRGFNGTVFAYGQTNSGKTHTMRGSAAEPGVIPLAVRDLFRTIHEDGDREFLLRMSYMEIYNEEINDLLAPEHRKLQIHESLERGIFVAGLREEIVASPEQVLDLMEFGESHRHFGETNMNIYSSRSHTIFRMIIESRDRTEDGDLGSSCDAVRVSVLSLVDLAGSERAAKTGAEGMRLKEGSHINKSLMTLGTVIKKLSEGVESQGGHVPYRDSKLTRILQPSLGGNANTAIICNISLAQIHADETKSSLQFASRALRVTNCARVNEILTDAALLKRQKKEIEELREKLQGSHSEHFEEEILNLRNTLLKSELERERIALELEEEKKAQALRERRLQEQAKKIENLSSMVLNSNLEEKRSPYKKEKRRDTWCPGALARKTLRREVSSTAQLEASIEEPIRNERDMGLPLPFEELMIGDEVVGAVDNPENNCLPDEKGNVHEVCRSYIPQDNCLMDQNGNNDLPGDFVPDANALLHVTNRRKAPVKKKSTLVQENSEAVEMHVEYEDLFLQFETQRTTKDIEIECLTKKVAETELQLEAKNFCPHTYQLSGSTVPGDGRESGAILLIKQLQEQIKILEMEKSSIQQNLNSVVELAKEKKTSAEVMHDEHCQEVSDALKEAEVAQQQLSPGISIRPIEEVNDKSIMEMSTEVQGIMSEFQSSRNVVESILTVVDELFGSFSDVSNMFLDLKSYACLNSTQFKTIISDHETMHSCMKKKIYELESDKSILYNQSIDLEKQIEELRLDLQESGRVLMEHHQLQESKEADFLSQIEKLEKEISCLSSCSLAREREMLRKEHEKTKVKLKETEAKLKNAIQDKTKLEGDKAQAEREIKRLHSQKALLERDISKRDSIAGSRRESFVDRRRDSFVDRRQETKMQGEYKKLEVLAFEMETTIASLEEELAASNAEKEEAYVKNESLASEMEAMSINLSTASSELELLQEEVSSMKTRLADSELLHQKTEITVNLLLEEKEELAKQLAEALLGMEEEKAIWSAKEKASIEAIIEKAKLSDVELMLLSKEMLEVRHELESLREECKVIAERLALSEESAEWERKCRMEKSAELDQLRNEIKISESENEKCQNILKSKFEMLSLEHRDACAKVEKLQAELSALDKERHKLLAQIEEMREGLDHTRDFQDLQDQLLIISTERDKLSAQNEEQQKLVIELETIKKNYDDMLSKARVDVEELTGQLSSMEIKKQHDSQSTNIEKTKLKMRLRGCQAKLDAHRGRYKEALDEIDAMHNNFKEASKKLKDKLASQGGELLHLKKQLAATNIHQNNSVI